MHMYYAGTEDGGVSGLLSRAQAVVLTRCVLVLQLPPPHRPGAAPAPQKGLPSQRTTLPGKGEDIPRLPLAGTLALDEKLSRPFNSRASRLQAASRPWGLAHGRRMGGSKKKPRAITDIIREAVRTLLSCAAAEEIRACAIFPMQPVRLGGLGATAGGQPVVVTIHIAGRSVWKRLVRRGGGREIVMGSALACERNSGQHGRLWVRGEEVLKIGAFRASLLNCQAIPRLA
ncbi:hypothetical protein C8Q80DRAFT_350156 [Daedaleopsis nitida]|nr:hypothetical protein C8Q80DRAFT_350156 [Daedaleopsis nitida]